MKQVWLVPPISHATIRLVGPSCQTDWDDGMQGVAVGETLMSFLPELSAWHLLTPCKLDIRESLLLSQVDISVSCIESERLRFPLPLPVRDL